MPLKCFLQLVTNVKESSFHLKVIKSKFIRTDHQGDFSIGYAIFRLETRFLLGNKIFTLEMSFLICKLFSSKNIYLALLDHHIDGDFLRNKSYNFFIVKKLHCEGVKFSYFLVGV